MWLAHDNFKEFLKENWKEGNDLNSMLSDFKDSVLSWNKEVFGLVEKTKNESLAHLRGIQNSNSYPYSNFLVNLEKRLQKELDVLLNLEEMKWFQKAKTEWIKSGDRNTRYYHLKSNFRRKRNRIVTLKYENGRWI